MLTIRFTRVGRKNDIKFRLVVKEKRSSRDGKYIDLLGFYDPVATPHKFTFDEEKLKSWIHKGAQVSDGVAKILPKKYYVKPPKVKKAKVTPNKASKEVVKEVKSTTTKVAAAKAKVVTKKVAPKTK